MMIRRGLLGAGGSGVDRYEETQLVSHYNMSSTGSGVGFSKFPSSIKLAVGDYIKVDLRGVIRPTNTQPVFLLTQEKTSNNAYVTIKPISNFYGTTYYIIDGNGLYLYGFDDIAYPANISFTVRFTGKYLKFEDVTVNGDKFEDSESTASYSDVEIIYYGLNESQLYMWNNYLGITYGKKL